MGRSVRRRRGRRCGRFLNRRSRRRHNAGRSVRGLLRGLARLRGCGRGAVGSGAWALTDVGTAVAAGLACLAPPPQAVSSTESASRSVTAV
ncbi:MAG: hypothetical protein WKH64_17370 [Chloroflexia bacterium]